MISAHVAATLFIYLCQSVLVDEASISNAPK